MTRTSLRLASIHGLTRSIMRTKVEAGRLSLKDFRFR
jgi:hypothetical protein